MTQLFDDNTELTKKQQRIRKAVMLYYGEDLTQEEVADKLGLTRSTIKRYLNSDDAQQFKRYFSDREEYLLKQWLEEELSHTFDTAKRELYRIIHNDEAEDKDRIRAIKLLMDKDSHARQMLQELGILEKAADKQEIQHSGDMDVDLIARLQEAHNELTTEEDEE